jgi:hypothetical protein
MYEQIWNFVIEIIGNHFFLRLFSILSLAIGFFLMFRRRRVIIGFILLFVSLLLALIPTFIRIFTV